MHFENSESSQCIVKFINLTIFTVLPKESTNEIVPRFSEVI